MFFDPERVRIERYELKFFYFILMFSVVPTQVFLSANFHQCFCLFIRFRSVKWGDQPILPVNLYFTEYQALTILFQSVAIAFRLFPIDRLTIFLINLRKSS